MWCQKSRGFTHKCKTLLPFAKSHPPSHLDKSIQKKSLVSWIHHKEEKDGHVYQTGVPILLKHKSSYCPSLLSLFFPISFSLYRLYFPHITSFLVSLSCSPFFNHILYLLLKPSRHPYTVILFICKYNVSLKLASSIYAAAVTVL